MKILFRRFNLDISVLFSEKSRMFHTRKTWMEGDAVEQFKRVLNLPGILRGAAMPDLHPGRGIPVGAAFLSSKLIYPVLIGSDIGCGMRFCKTDLPEYKFKCDALIRKLTDQPETRIRLIARRLLKERREDGIHDPAHLLGTLGHGNHFAELLCVDTVVEPELFEKYALEYKKLYLLIHSGSRGYGEKLWMSFCSDFRDRGAEADSEAGKRYLSEHDRLIRWGAFNRGVLADTSGELLGCRCDAVLDNVHNSITEYQPGYWLHRKGAAEAKTGEPVIIAGSRGTCSYLVEALNPSEETLFSLAHGAGRKWTRQSTRARISERFSERELLKTKIGSRVVCPDKNLLYEEAPEAYKNIVQVIEDMREFGLIRIIARFRPVLNCKP